MTLQVQFEFGQEGRVSDPYGPFEYIQITYNAVRVGPEGERELAYLNIEKGLWVTDDGQEWSDMTFMARA